MPSKILRFIVTVTAAAEIVLLGLLLSYVNGHRIIRLDEVSPPEATGTQYVHGLYFSDDILSAENADALSQEAVSRAVKEEVIENYGELVTLVNPWNKLKEGYTPKLSVIEDDYQVDVRCADALRHMLDDCRKAGNPAVLCSAYRTAQYQQGLYDNKIRRLMQEGVSRDDAPAQAARSVAVPGTSEHQLGLAVDIIDFNYPYLDSEQENTPTQKWLMKHCAEYGFILRYPNGSSKITGIIYEPWHYRYVGGVSAKEITRRGITLEEYLSEP